MTIKVEPGEPLHPVIQAIEKCTGRRLHKSNISRWCNDGSRGIKFPFIFVGGQRMTSCEATWRWLSAVTAARQGGVPAAQTPKQRAKEVERAERELAEAGW